MISNFLFWPEGTHFSMIFFDFQNIKKVVLFNSHIYYFTLHSWLSFCIILNTIWQHEETIGHQRTYKYCRIGHYSHLMCEESKPRFETYLYVHISLGLVSRMDIAHCTIAPPRQRFPCSYHTRLLITSFWQKMRVHPLPHHHLIYRISENVTIYIPPSQTRTQIIDIILI